MKFHIKNLATLLWLVSAVSGQLNPTGCGLGTPLLRTSRIVGGAPAKKGDWGWQVALNIKNKIRCGGVLLSANWVLTSASCIPKSQLERDQLNVDVGFQDLLAADPWSARRPVSKIFIHEDYTLNNLVHFNDVALLKLARPVELDPVEHKVVPACVPEALASDGNTGWLTGYGMLFSGGSFTSVLRQVQVPILAADMCSKYYKDFNPATQVCAGGLGKDACLGDNGGPLVARRPEDARWFLVGITSYSSSPCGGGSVYTRVSGFRDWMTRVISLN